MSRDQNEFSGEEDLPLTDGWGVAAACGRYSLLLTALFDGEASAAEEVAARAHLARCARCAAMWSSWSQTRGVWRATPPAQVPSGLLLRILMTCRLAALRRAKTGVNSQAKVSGNAARQEQPGYLVAAFETPPVPSHLREAILQRTVGTTVNSAPPMIVPPTVSTRKAAWLSSVTIKRATRWATPVAVPAALVLMASITGQLPDNRSTLVVPSTSQYKMSAAPSNTQSRVAQASRNLVRRIDSASRPTSSKLSSAAKPEATEPLIADTESANLQSQRGTLSREISAERNSATPRNTNQNVGTMPAGRVLGPVPVKLATRPARVWPSASASLAASTRAPVWTMTLLTLML
jgi:hypothetical protein